MRTRSVLSAASICAASICLASCQSPTGAAKQSLPYAGYMTGGQTPTAGFMARYRANVDANRKTYIERLAGDSSAYSADIMTGTIEIGEPEEAVQATFGQCLSIGHDQLYTKEICGIRNDGGPKVWISVDNRLRVTGFGSMPEQ